MIARSYKFRLYPTPRQAERLDAWQAACWEIQRLLVLQRRIAANRLSISLWGGRDARGRDRWWRRRLAKLSGPTWAGQSREVTVLLAAEPALRDCPRDCIDAVVKRVDEAQQRAIKRFKETGRWSRIRWAERAADVGLQFRGQPERGTQMIGQRGRFSYWKLAAAHSLGALKVRQHRRFPDGVQVRQAHITRAADGWYISFSCLIPDEAPAPALDVQIGIDLNVKHDGNDQEVVSVCSGRKYMSPDGLKRNARRLATLQKLVDPKRRVRGTAKAADPHSKRTAKRRAKIARLHQKVARQREHTQQYIARRLVDTAQSIGVEKLPHQGMRRKGKGRRKRGLNRALSTAAPGRMVALIKEKASQDGRAVIEVDPRNTTQACSACGDISPRKKGLNDRHWRCDACGAQHDRDINAARNVCARAHRTPRCSSGELPGEGRATQGSERGPLNLEGASAPARENTSTRTTIPRVRKSTAKLRKQQVATQLTLFDTG